MADVDFTNQFSNKVVHVIAVGTIGQQLSVFFFHGRPVHAVHVGRIEEVAHLTPGLVVDLRPLSTQVDPFLHVAEVDGFIAFAALA